MRDLLIAGVGPPALDPEVESVSVTLYTRQT
jgi:hypothetical protein